MTPTLHARAIRLVAERKAPDYRAACSMISRSRRNKNKQLTTPTRAIRLPYADS